jgi:hypothetical protein
MLTQGAGLRSSRTFETEDFQNRQKKHTNFKV